jgi:hypothetical protein
VQPGSVIGDKSRLHSLTCPADSQRVLSPGFDSYPFVSLRVRRLTVLRLASTA